MDIRKLTKASQVGTVNTQIPTADPTDSINKKTSSVTEEISTPETQENAEDILTDSQIEEYREYLYANNVTDTDIFSVLDAIITTGTVYWSFEMLGKIPVVFRMRPTWVNEYLLAEIENQAPKMYSRFTDIISRVNLAGSLYRYGEMDFVVEDVEALQEAEKFVSGLGFILQNKLIQQLALFDRVVAVATSTWAVENFTEPQQAE